MKRALMGILILLAIMVTAVGVLFAAAPLLAERKQNRQIEIDVAPVAFTQDAAVLTQGKYLFDSRGCAECHGGGGEGRILIDSPDGFHVRTPNITSDSAVIRYTERDWVRIIRHGVKPDGRPALIMPSEDYNRLTDTDLAALVAYVRSLPARSGESAQVRMPRLLKALYAMGVMSDAAEKIDHTLAPAKPVEVAVSVAHGSYVANMCIGCHGAGLSGGKIPGTPPDWPPAANITQGPASAMPVYDTKEKFRVMMRTGKRPDGGTVSAVMPFESLKAMTDVDLDAMYVFLKTVPPKAGGGR